MYPYYPFYLFLFVFHRKNIALTRPVSSGVLQGSVFPILFIIYLYDMQRPT